MHCTAASSSSSFSSPAIVSARAQHFRLLHGAAEIHVTARHLQVHARREARICAVLLFQQRDALVEQLERRERLARGAYFFEHHAHELAGGFRALRLESRFVPLQRDLVRLPRHEGAERRRGQEQSARERHGDAMARSELAQAIDRGRRAREHGLVRKMAPDVRRHLGRRPVAAIAILLQRLQHDPVEIARQVAPRAGAV